MANSKDCATALASAEQRFNDRNPKSFEYHQSAVESLPGGNTRSLLHTAPYPVVMNRGEGSKLFDLDGHVYQDFVGELTAAIYGHSHPRIKEAMMHVLDNVGLSLGATNVYEKKYAELLCARFNIPTVRFANSGTEANLHCVAAARRFTGRRKVVVFRGGYHGSVLSFAFGAAANNVDPQDWLVSQYNDIRALERVFEEHADIAAVLVEAMQGSGGGLAGSQEFLRAIRLFILDEVMTSRLHPAGLAATLDEAPDMKTFGKYLGGGMPFGAFGGRQDIMAVYDPRQSGSLAHSGTFQNNTLMLNAGYTGLKEIYTPAAADALNQRGEELRNKLLAVFAGTKFTVTGVGSLMCIHCTTTGVGADEIHCKDDYWPHDYADLKRLFWLEMLEAGYWIHQRGSIALMLTMEPAVIDDFVGQVKEFCIRHQRLVAKHD
ncbi:unnamed protein product [Clonostachys byssicola]|uniref:Uncharacterized protein n=1 Tax=Clonostachys byssicola TaxID=160290 RepID=A0A9N9TZX6_9HYPO|nr:unnamed protein product [Clonostachys byssicola]